MNVFIYWVKEGSGEGVGRVTRGFVWGQTARERTAGDAGSSPPFCCIHANPGAELVPLVLVVRRNSFTPRLGRRPLWLAQVYNMMASTMGTLASRSHGAKYIYGDPTSGYGFMQVRRVYLFFGLHVHLFLGRERAGRNDAISKWAGAWTP